MKKLLVLFILIWALPAHALEPGTRDVYVRVVDVGPGLCTITKIPNSEPLSSDHHYMVYDAGHWNGGRCIDAVNAIVDEDTIDLLVLSHSDADHLGDADEILENYTVRQVVRTGFVRRSGTWENMNELVGLHASTGGSILNLQSVDLEPGSRMSLGDAEIIFIAGWNKWVGSGPTASEKRNASSIVVQLVYQGHSVLFTGDTIGRRLSDPNNACKDAEAVMVSRVAEVPLHSDVIIAPHHGGNNGSSTCFINAVDPTFVIFSAGHQHDHPSNEAAQRYLNHGIPTSQIFRTDLGDDEGGFEWNEGRIAGCRDPRGDDDVEIVLRRNGNPLVEYRNVSTGCS